MKKIGYQGCLGNRYAFTPEKDAFIRVQERIQDAVVFVQINNRIHTHKSLFICILLFDKAHFPLFFMTKCFF